MGDEAAREQLLAAPAAGPRPVIAAGTGLAPANLSHVLRGVRRLRRAVIALNRSLHLQSASVRRARGGGSAACDVMHGERPLHAHNKTESLSSGGARAPFAEAHSLIKT